jgi:hypothetical protein
VGAFADQQPAWAGAIHLAVDGQGEPNSVGQNRNTTKSLDEMSSDVAAISAFFGDDV